MLPLAALDRPRVDVTLRISGLFRDAFAAQIALFDRRCSAIAARDEPGDWNPLTAGTGARVFGPAAGAYGSGVALDGTRQDAARSYLAGSAVAWDSETGSADAAGFAARVQQRTASSMPRTMRRPISWKAPTMPRMRAVSRRRRPCSAAL